MSAPVTKQHLKFIDEIRVGDRSMRFDITDAQAAQLIADSEAKACAELRAELDAQCLLNAKGSEREAVLLRRVDRMAKECLNLRADLDAIKAIRNEETARAERAEADLHALRLVCGTTDADKFSTWVDRANARAEKAEAELAAERGKVRMLHSALQNLADEQNGAPLERQREEWQEAMDEACAALAATEETK